MQLTRVNGPGFAMSLSIACCLSVQSADASAQKTGANGRTTKVTGTGSIAGKSNVRRAVPLPYATMRGFAPQIVFKDNLSGSQVRNGLPPTKLDGFVRNAHENAEHIYGDESTAHGPPPYMSFSEVHRINAGIKDNRDAGLTTGHGSYLPDAWGRDEILGEPEFSQSGQYDPQADALPLRRDYVNKWDTKDGVSPRQFPNGSVHFGKVIYYDEDRVRPPSDPYYQFLLYRRLYGLKNPPW